MSTADILNRHMKQYRTEHLKGIGVNEFTRQIQSLPGSVYQGIGQEQREFERAFTWGHDHDFGTFKMKGQMGDRHMRVLEWFIDHGIKFEGRVLDVGCWTGGTSLLLASMGCNVVAVEEVACYAAAAEYLAESFGVSNLAVVTAPMQRLLEEPALVIRDFNLVLMAGVLYHVTDPLLVLRTAFECLRDGGELLVETAIAEGQKEMLVYCGLRHGGYRWYRPTISALRAMMEDVGFDVVWVQSIGHRACARGVRKEYRPMIQAGLSWRP